MSTHTSINTPEATNRAQEWLDKYYPIDASDTNLSEALDHCIKKWEGAEPKILAEYGLVLDCGIIRDASGSYGLVYNGDTCALCFHYQKEFDKSEYDDDCSDCPLYRHLGTECYSEKNSPYQIFIQTGNPTPMIEALKEVQEKSKLTRKKEPI